MNENVAIESEGIIVRQLDALRNYSYADALHVAETHADAIVGGKRATVSTWRKQLSSGECLIAVTVDVPGWQGTFHTRYERGLLFTSNGLVREVNDPEIELDGN